MYWNIQKNAVWVWKVPLTTLGTLSIYTILTKYIERNRYVALKKGAAQVEKYLNLKSDLFQENVQLRMWFWVDGHLKERKEYIVKNGLKRCDNAHFLVYIVKSRQLEKVRFRGKKSDVYVTTHYLHLFPYKNTIPYQ